MRSESEFSTFVIDTIKPLLSGKNFLIKENKNVLTDLTCVPENGTFELIHGFSETDIAIYKELKFNAKNEPTSLIKFYGDSDIRQGTIAIPFVIFELKTGELTTDGIRSRDFVASRIRSIFPFSAYYMIAECTRKEEKTLLRQGKNFTNYFIFQEQITAEDLSKIYRNYIDPHINNLNSRFNS